MELQRYIMTDCIFVVAYDDLHIYLDIYIKYVDDWNGSFSIYTFSLTKRLSIDY